MVSADTLHQIVSPLSSVQCPPPTDVGHQLVMTMPCPRVTLRGPDDNNSSNRPSNQPPNYPLSSEQFSLRTILMNPCSLSHSENCPATRTQHMISHSMFYTHIFRSYLVRRILKIFYCSESVLNDDPIDYCYILLQVTDNEKIRSF